MISRRTEDKPAQICLIDYGLCKQYFKNGEHIALKTDKKMIGTVIFCSRNAHQGLELSRRDDLIAWLYMIVYLVRKLPWED